MKSNFLKEDIMLEREKHVQKRRIVIYGMWYGLLSRSCGITALFRRARVEMRSKG